MRLLAPSHKTAMIKIQKFYSIISSPLCSEVQFVGSAIYFSVIFIPTCKPSYREIYATSP